MIQYLIVYKYLYTDIGHRNKSMTLFIISYNMIKVYTLDL